MFPPRTAPGSFLDRLDGFLTPWVKRLLVANVAVHLVAWVVGRGFMVQWFGFTPAEILFRPWTLLSYMFVHGDLWHLLFNMLVVFFFGPPLERRLGGAEFLRLYVLGGVGGALAAFAFAFSTPVIGASAGVYALMLAFAWYWPNAPIYIWGIFPVKAKYLVGALVVLTFFSTFSAAPSTTAHFAHLGGLVAGFLYLRFAPGGRREEPVYWRGEPVSGRGAGGGRGGGPGWRSGDAKGSGGRGVFGLAVFRRSAGEDGEKGGDAPRRGGRGALRGPGSSAGSDASASPERGRTRGRGGRAEGELLDEVDRILDKISESGMASLTPSERAVLDEVSRRRRSN